MKQVGIFFVCGLGSCLAFVVLRVLAIRYWGVEPGGVLGEFVPGLASGAGAAAACFFIAERLLECEAAQRAAFASFALIGTIVAITTVFGLLSDAEYEGSRAVLAASLVATTTGFFGFGMLRPR